MKSNKVLFGLFAAAMALLATPVAAQSSFGDDFHEVGPDNVGGPVSSLVVDRNDPATVYAGAYTGGVFVRHSLDQLNWDRVPYMENGVEVNLPVSSMVQLPDGKVLVGTGDGYNSPYSRHGAMTQKGVGLLVLDPSTGNYTRIPGSEPAGDFGDLHAYYKLDYTVGQDADGVNYLFIYAGTYRGLYRFWVPCGEGGAIDMSTLAGADIIPEIVWSSNHPVSDLVLSRDRNVAYFAGVESQPINDTEYMFTTQLFKVSNINQEQVDIENLSEAHPEIFDGSYSNIALGMAPSDNNYVYALLAYKGTYLTTNDQDWTLLSSSTVQPLGSIGWYNSAIGHGTICVNDTNPKQIYVGGQTIWSGRGYVEGSYYQWMRTSSYEFQLLYGVDGSSSYMANVFSSAGFVHSGIHQIVQSTTTLAGTEVPVYYIATDGGVFVTYNSFATYSNLNRGLNCTQINDVAVAPDGSVISGSSHAAAPFIQSRLAHFGGAVNTSWFDDGSLGNMNHDANILWGEPAGHVAASSFQQLEPQNKRTLFISSNFGYTPFPSTSPKNIIGRSFGDYLDYSQTQTWTTGQAFTGHFISSGTNYLGYISLWENDNDQYMIDSSDVHIDLKGVLRPNGVDTLGYYTYNGQQVPIRNHTDTIPAGATVQFLSKNNNDYPFEYTFTEPILAGDTIRVKNPIQSRGLVIGTSPEGYHEVFYAVTPSDFSHVYDANTYNTRYNFDKQMFWYSVYSFDPNIYETGGTRWPTSAVMSKDGRFLYVAVSDYTLGTGMLVRVSGFDSINFNASPDSLDIWLKNRTGNPMNRLHNQVLMYQDGEDGEWFPRCISSISIDPRDGEDRLLVTFEGSRSEFSNVMIVNNASTDNWSFQEVQNPYALSAAFSGIIEKTTGNIILGTNDGVVYSDPQGSQWTEYPHLKGVAVTSIVQQTRNYPVRRHHGYSGINEVSYLYAKTKWPGAIYFGTYGRGIFLDMQYVTDRTNEVLDPEDLGIPTVAGNGLGSINVYPNPAVGNVSIELNANSEGNARMTVYDLNGRMVSNVELGHVDEGTTTFGYDSSTLPQGMYLVNINVAGHTAATKLIVR